MHHAPSGPVTHGLVAEFDSPEKLMEAANRAREHGYKALDAYTPFPVHGMSEAIGFHENIIPWIVAMGGLTGTLTGITLQYYTAVVDYPMNVGGKPLFALPTFVPVMYECTILFAGLTAFFGLWALCGLPKLYHPIFSTPNFDRATVDRFFLCIEATDPAYDSDKTRSFLESQNPLKVTEVEEEV
jgi:hypothetical protein